MQKAYEEQIKTVLDEKRYRHSVGVANEAVRIAKAYGVNEEKAYTAGILHDCAKCIPIDEQITLCGELGVELDEITLACPAVIHAPLGAKLAEVKYGVKDLEILDAVKWHTTARKNMTMLDKIIYIADLTEPSRDYNGVDELREAVATDLEEAFVIALGRSILFNTQQKNIIHPDTLFAWNYELGRLGG